MTAGDPEVIVLYLSPLRLSAAIALGILGGWHLVLFFGRVSEVLSDAGAFVGTWIRHLLERCDACHRRRGHPIHRPPYGADELVADEKHRFFKATQRLGVEISVKATGERTASEIAADVNRLGRRAARKRDLY